VLKKCAKCGDNLPLDRFYKKKSSPDGHNGYCKSCNNVSRKGYYAANIGSKRRNDLKHKYGITPQQFEDLAASQNYCCAICLRASPDGKPLFVDHCHHTGKVRGLLCRYCNTAIGQMLDDPTRLRRAAEYVQLHALP
jgi:hypothetical protein